MLLPLHSLCALDALRAPPPPNPPPPAGSVAGAFAALAAREEFFDGPSPAPPPASAVLRLWWRTSELEGQWDSAQLARYLYWTVGWRKLDVHTCEEARESWFLCQQMMAAHPDYGHIGHDMGENISRELWELGYRSEGVSALE